MCEVSEVPVVRDLIERVFFAGYPDFLILVASAVEKGKEEESGIGSYFGSSFRFLTNLLVDQNLQGNFGYFIDRNNTDDGVVTIFTGEDERSKINRVDVVNGKKELTTWPIARCNKISGTMGHLRPPDSGEKPVEIFVPDLCRSLPLRYEKESMYEGLSTLRFVAGKETFDNSKSTSCFAGPRNFSSGASSSSLLFLYFLFFFYYFVFIYFLFTLAVKSKTSTSAQFVQNYIVFAKQQRKN